MILAAAIAMTLLCGAALADEVSFGDAVFDRGAASIDMGGQVMDMPYKDIKCDDHGNWISRKSSMMGQEMEQTRKIEYYE